MSERLGNLGYLLMGKETTKGTPVIPATTIPIYKESFNTMLNHDEDNPIVGLNVMPFNMFMGMRGHQGSFTALGDPNIAQYLFDMAMTQGSVTGAGPYTHPFTIGTTVKPYTIDILKGQVVHRYWGVEAEEIEVAYNKNKMELTPKVAALGSFIVREIASVSTTTITLTTTYDPTRCCSILCVSIAHEVVLETSSPKNYNGWRSWLVMSGFSATRRSSKRPSRRAAIVWYGKFPWWVV